MYYLPTDFLITKTAIYLKIASFLVEQNVQMEKRQIHRLLFMHIAFLPVAHLFAVLECVTGIKIEWGSKQAT